MSLVFLEPQNKKSWLILVWYLKGQNKKSWLILVWHWLDVNLPGCVLMVIETEKLFPRPDLPTNRRSLNFATWTWKSICKKLVFLFILGENQTYQTFNIIMYQKMRVMQYANNKNQIETGFTLFDVIDHFVSLLWSQLLN